ncbi:MAG: hypothetical protein DA408_14195, partial [Bacteroidetes bacterium]
MLFEVLAPDEDLLKIGKKIRTVVGRNPYGLLVQKHDVIWLFGTPRLLPTSTNFGGSLLDFRQGSPEVSYFDLALDLDPTAIMCDAE